MGLHRTGVLTTKGTNKSDKNKNRIAIEEAIFYDRSREIRDGRINADCWHQQKRAIRYCKQT